MSEAGGCAYEFGPFRLDTTERLLLRDGRPVPLTPKAFETLLALVERRGHVLEKEELMRRIWPDTIVEEANLAQNVFSIRKAMGQMEGGRQYIETIPRRGYCFVAEVREITNGRSSQSRSKRSRPFWAIGAAAALIAVVAVAFGLRRMISSPAGANNSFRAMKIVRLTGAGNALTAAISPDGKYVAYVMDDAGKKSLWVRQVAATSQAQIVPPAELDYLGVTFSHDGNWIYYVRDDILYRAPALGGDSQKLLEGVDSAVTLSPDDQRLAFVRGFLNRGEVALMIANCDGGGEKKLAVRRLPEYFRSAAWSPDGKTIACAGGTRAGNYMTVVAVDVDGGAERLVTARKWLGVKRIEWLRDAKGIIAAAEEAPDFSQLWLISWPSGEVSPITNDLNNYRGASVTADSRVIATVESAEFSSLWILSNSSFGDESRARQLTPTASHDGWPSWTPDGRIVYQSRAGGKLDIWIMDPSRGDKKQLTRDSSINYLPAVSPDGRYVFFTSNRAGPPNIWRMKIDGSDAVRLTSGWEDIEPNCSPDGRWVVYTSYNSGEPALWRVAIDGGAPAQLTRRLSRAPFISPDGKWIASYYWNEQPGSPTEIAVVPFDGGEPVKTFEIPPHVISPAIAQWTTDGRALTMVEHRGGVSNILRRPFSGAFNEPLDRGRPEQLTGFHSDLIFHFAWSREIGRAHV